MKNKKTIKNKFSFPSYVVMVKETTSTVTYGFSSAIAAKSFIEELDKQNFKTINVSKVYKVLKK